MHKLFYERVGSKNPIPFIALKVLEPKSSNFLEVINKQENSILVEIQEGLNTHYELYWFIYDRNCWDSESRNDYFREGRNVIIKIFSFQKAGIADEFQLKICENETVKHHLYYSVDFNLERFLKDQPVNLKRFIKYMI